MKQNLPLTFGTNLWETACEHVDGASSRCRQGDLEPVNGAVGVEIASPNQLSPFRPLPQNMKIADRVDLIGAYGVVGRVHAMFAKKLIAAGKGRPIRNKGITVAIQLPSVPCGERDLEFHGGNSGRQHFTEVCDGGQTLVIETETTLPRTVTTKSCRVIALKYSGRVLGEVLTAERAELMA